MIHTKAKIYILLFFSILLLFILFLFSSKKLSNTLQIEYNGTDFLLFYQDNSRSNTENNFMQIFSYYNDVTAEHCLFLPSFFQNTPCDLTLFGIDEIVVDQTFYQTSSPVDFLTPGRHSVAIDGTFYVFNIQFGSEINSIFIETASCNSINQLNTSREHNETGSINFYSPNGSLQHSNTLESIHSRGNANWDLFPKKSYTFKLSGNVPLTGTGATDEWTLSSNARDNSNLRNKIAFDIGEQIGLDSAFSSLFTDLYVDGYYIGLYLLTPKIDISKACVNISNLYKNTKEMNTLPLKEYPTYASHTPPPRTNSARI